MPPQIAFGPTDITMKDWMERFYPSLSSRLVECVQEAGTVLYVPDGWYHATINLEDSIGIAVEVGPNLILDENDPEATTKPPKKPGSKFSNARFKRDKKKQATPAPDPESELDNDDAGLDEL